MNESIDSPDTKKVYLVSGGSRSGKSRWAEYLLLDHTKVKYLATGSSTKHDHEWNIRVAKHKERRPEHWQTIEVKNDLVNCVRSHQTNCLLLDSLGGFVAQNLEENECRWEYLTREFINSIKTHKSTMVIVIEQTGWSLTPLSREGRLFTDRLGSLAQELEFYSDNSWLVIHGRAINMNANSFIIPKS